VPRSDPERLVVDPKPGPTVPLHEMWQAYSPARPRQVDGKRPTLLLARHHEISGHKGGMPTNQELREAENLVPRLVMLRMGYEGGTKIS